MHSYGIGNKPETTFDILLDKINLIQEDIKLKDDEAAQVKSNHFFDHFKNDVMEAEPLKTITDHMNERLKRSVVQGIQHKKTGQGRTPCCTLISIMYAHLVSCEDISDWISSQKDTYLSGCYMVGLLCEVIVWARKHFTAIMNVYQKINDAPQPTPELVPFLKLMREKMYGHCKYLQPDGKFSNKLEFDNEFCITWLDIKAMIELVAKFSNSNDDTTGNVIFGKRL